MNTPIVIFAYQRADLLSKMLDSLANCHEIGGRSIYAFVDGPKNGADALQLKVKNDVLAVLTNHRLDIDVAASEINKGLARSVHSGVSAVLNNYETAIVLEDDLLLAPDFLTFMDACLRNYQNRSDIYSISGFCHLNADTRAKQDAFLFPRPGSWGWATWASRWQGFQMDAIDKDLLKDRKEMAAFNRGGRDLSWMLRQQLNGRVNSWAVQWAWYQHINKAFSVYPACSKTSNTGFGEGATHTRNSKSKQQSAAEICSTPLSPPMDLKPDSDQIRSYRKYYPLGKFSAFKEKWLR